MSSPSRPRRTSRVPTPVAILMGSASDMKVMSQASGLLEEFAVKYYLNIISAHRTPEDLYEFGRTACDHGFSVVIAGAGGAAHLPGMLASLTTLPVIGVPVELKTLAGLDSLLSIVQMPAGVPVATVGINQAGNAALLALQILSLNDPNLHVRLIEYRQKLKAKVVADRPENLRKI